MFSPWKDPLQYVLGKHVMTTITGDIKMATWYKITTLKLKCFAIVCFSHMDSNIPTAPIPVCLPFQSINYKNYISGESTLKEQKCQTVIKYSLIL